MVLFLEQQWPLKNVGKPQKAAEKQRKSLETRCVKLLHYISKLRSSSLVQKILDSEKFWVNSSRGKLIFLKSLGKVKTTKLQACFMNNRPFNYSKKESESNDVLMQFEELSNVHNSDRRSNATRSNVLYKNAQK